MITIISATNRPNSNTLKIARIYNQLMEIQGLTSKILTLESLPVDIAFGDLYGNRSEEFQKLLNEFIIPAQKFVVISPEYNGSFPGILKIFLDALPPELNRGKKVSLIGVSSGRGGNMRGMDHLTGIFNYLGLHVHHNKLAISNVLSLLDEQGNVTDERTIHFFNKHILDLIRW
ncbi:MAG: hypothetical protein A3F72_10145 [Bacteroidetes bacterium RIFCSPLOWO2_12_FULL_35_15]|nr:MAG: hypothetical protein A3F72_10145 [Bacteroidetes bacterium RIFCSPLOWO2_12_FULL_35_15]